MVEIRLSLMILEDKMYKFATVALLIIVSFFGGVLSQKNCSFVQRLTDGKVCAVCCVVDENCECHCGKQDCELCVSCSCHKR